ncbi:MAG: 50S ribosomal protein L24 [Anaerolineaceae bacterium]
MKMKIRKGDRVKVLRGDKEDKGKVGEVIRVFPKEERIAVQGVNIVKKHQKQTQSGGKTIPSGILEFEAPIHISNVEKVSESIEKTSREGTTTKAGKAVKTTNTTKTAKVTKTDKDTKVAKPVVKKPAAKPAKPAATKTSKPTAKAEGDAKPAAKKRTAAKPAPKQSGSEK